MISLPIERTNILGDGFGYVALTDVMGDDRTPARTARTSFRNADKERTEEQDAKLVDYLVQHDHNTPQEFCQVRFYCKLPIVVARQLVRQRTQCIAGDVPVSFDLPKCERRERGDRSHYTLTMRELYDRWQRVEDGRPEQNFGEYYKRERIQKMRLRSLNEETNKIYHTTIKDIWYSGVKSVYEVKFANGSELRASMDHRCFTTAGWLTLEEALEQGVQLISLQRKPAVSPAFQEYTSNELAAEEWRPVLGYSKYEVSNLGRVRSLVNTRNVALPEPKLKLQTKTPAGYHVVSLSDDGRSRAYLVHHLVLTAFAPRREAGQETRHRDGCRINNRVTNLTWGTAQENTQDRVDAGNDGWLHGTPVSVVSAEYIGEIECFDLEVEGPFHNFVAGGVVVHNSINEVSYRYVTAAREFYVPPLARMKKKAETNKQGSSSTVVDKPEYCATIMADACNRSFDTYEELLRQELAPELARMVLPVSTYTEWYTQMALTNFFKSVVALRATEYAPHAQEECQLYADAMLDLVAQAFPVITASWRKKLDAWK